MARSPLPEAISRPSGLMARAVTVSPCRYPSSPQWSSSQGMSWPANWNWATARGSNALDAMDRALETGIQFFDTANVYGRGRSEEVTGEALARNGRRQQIVLATKVHGRMDDDDPNMQGNSRRHIIQQAEAFITLVPLDAALDDTKFSTIAIAIGSQQVGSQLIAVSRSLGCSPGVVEIAGLPTVDM